MKRRHGFFLATVLGLAAVAGSYAAMQTTDLGAQAATLSEQEIAAADVRLDKQEAALRQAARKRPPRLPKLPAKASGAPINAAAAAPARAAPAAAPSGSFGAGSSGSPGGPDDSGHGSYDDHGGDDDFDDDFEDDYEDHVDDLEDAREDAEDHSGGGDDD